MPEFNKQLFSTIRLADIRKIRNRDKDASRLADLICANVLPLDGTEAMVSLPTLIRLILAVKPATPQTIANYLRDLGFTGERTTTRYLDPHLKQLHSQSKVYVKDVTQDGIVYANDSSQSFKPNHTAPTVDPLDLLARYGYMNPKPKGSASRTPKRRTPKFTRATLERTTWAKEFKKVTAPSSYETAIKYALDPNLRVEIIKTLEMGESAQYAIAIPSHSTHFWMDAKPTHKEAAKLIRTMGWKYA